MSSSSRRGRRRPEGPGADPGAPGGGAHPALATEERNRQADANASAFRTIVRTTLDAIVIVDAQANVRLANPAAERLFGKSADELVGAMFGFPIVADETAEIDIVRTDGQEVVGELRATVVEWEGEPAYLASIRDITERRRAEEHEQRLIREQAARAEAEAGERRARFLGEASRILLSSPDEPRTLQSLAELSVPLLGDCCMIDVLEADGRIRRAAAAMAGEGGHDLARRLCDVRPQASPDSVIDRVLRLHRTEVLPSVDRPTLDALAGEVGGELLALGCDTGAIVPVTNGNAVGYIVLLCRPERAPYSRADLATAEDIARRVLLAIQNKRLYEEAQQGNRAKTEFLAVMSHELRTPLNAMLGYSDLLLMGLPAALPPAARRHVERIQLSSRHLLGLIEEILAYARAEAGREHVQHDIISLAEIMREAGDLTVPLARAKRVGFEVELPPRDVTLRTDGRKVRQILLNLLSNAVKFTEEGIVRLCARVADDAIEIAVIDTGIGIPPDALEHIFEPFWQAESSHTRRAEGTGLGLSVARRFARLLGGDVTVSSERGRGSTFYVRIPLLPPQYRHAAEADASTRPEPERRHTKTR